MGIGADHSWLNSGWRSARTDPAWRDGYTGRNNSRAGKFRLRQVVVLQLGRVGAGFLNRNQFGSLAGVLGADAVVFLPDLRGELRPVLGADQIAHRRHGA